MPSLLPTPEPADPVEGQPGHFEHSNWLKASVKALDTGIAASASDISALQAGVDSVRRKVGAYNAHRAAAVGEQIQWNYGFGNGLPVADSWIETLPGVASFYRVSAQLWGTVAHVELRAFNGTTWDVVWNFVSGTSMSVILVLPPAKKYSLFLKEGSVNDDSLASGFSMEYLGQPGGQWP